MEGFQISDHMEGISPEPRALAENPLRHTGRKRRCSPSQARVPGRPSARDPRLASAPSTRSGSSCSASQNATKPSSPSRAQPGRPPAGPRPPPPRGARKPASPRHPLGSPAPSPLRPPPAPPQARPGLLLRPRRHSPPARLRSSSRSPPLHSCAAAAAQQLPGRAHSAITSAPGTAHKPERPRAGGRRRIVRACTDEGASRARAGWGFEYQPGSASSHSARPQPPGRSPGQGAGRETGPRALTSVTGEESETLYVKRLHVRVTLCEGERSCV